ncbi:hypothetical protein HPP92_001492 [Vanilla planifolia]|uniref:Uncharacterized protein n=1 Tax=Vanilla planifolia TaxID=51239 RepID=A0A835RY97_VANPL|nr:hypothetical protein HPP92_001492 [Vanilla planifolia]
MDAKRKLSRKGSTNSRSKREASSSAAASLKRSSSASDANAESSGAQSFTSRCANLAKERRARFYIVRRCVSMLICWRDYP